MVQIKIHKRYHHRKQIAAASQSVLGIVCSQQC